MDVVTAARVKTTGNPLAHAVLRGAVNHYGTAIPNYHYEDLVRTAEAYDRHPFERLSMSTLTLSVSKETYLRIKEEIAGLRKKISHLAETDKGPDRVYQLNYQLFPLSRIEEKRDKT